MLRTHGTARHDREDRDIDTRAEAQEPLEPGSSRKSRARFLTTFVPDLVLAVVVMVVLAVAISVDVPVSSDSIGPGLTAYGFCVGFGALMFLRRRWPVATLVLTAAGLIAYYTLSYPPIGLAVPAAAALYSAAERGRTRWAVAVAIGLLSVSTLFRLAEGDDPGYLLGFELATSAGPMAAVIALGDGVRSRRGWRHELEKQARAADLEQQRAQARVAEAERLRIARDLHDLLGHTVSVISLHTDVARETLRDDPDTAERSLASVRAACGEVITELRATVRALRLPEDADGVQTPGLGHLNALVATVTAAGPRVGVDIRGEPVTLPAVADAAAYRVVQEALSNVLKHSGASTVSVGLDYGPESLRLRIHDDGQGADASVVTGGWGIMGMRERLTLLGGELWTHTRSGEGFEVNVSIPYEVGA